MIIRILNICRFLTPEMIIARQVRKGFVIFRPDDPIYRKLAAFVRVQCVERDLCRMDCPGREWCLWEHRETGEIRGTWNR